MEEEPKINTTPQVIKPKNHPVLIDDEYLSQNCIEKCIEEFNKIKSGVHNSPLEIITTKKVLEVDPLLIAYFILFKKEIDSLEIILNLHDDTQDDIIAKVGQYKMHALFTCGEDVFSLPIHKSELIPESWIVWSESFLPITFIDVTKYEVTFIELIKFQNLNGKVVYEKNPNKLYNRCRQFLYNKFLTEKDGLLYLSQLAFYKALEDAKILSFYLYKDFHYNQEITEEVCIKEKYQIGTSLRKEKAFRFYKAVQETLIFNELSKKPPIYSFIYATLLSSDLLPGEFNSENSKDIINTLKNLWVFTQQLVDGLDELAKNIYEHSSQHCGVITGRVYSGSMLKELRSTIIESKELFETYLNSFKNPKGIIRQSFFEINVIDGGEYGVVQKVKDDLENTYNPEFEQDDIDLISNNKIKFRNFLKPSNGQLLIQQTKRATAHLGLLIFSKLIEENKGLIRAGTWAINSTTDRDNVLTFPEMEKFQFNNDSAPLCPFGTNYHFLLPFNPNEPVKPTIPIKYELPFESTTLEMKNIEDLLNYDVKDYSVGHVYDVSLEPGKNYLFITNSSQKLSAATREEEYEFWKEIKDAFFLPHLEQIKSSNPKKKSFVCLDLNKSGINVSQLFRLLGRWELGFSGCPLIVFNIPVDLFFKLIEINEYYYFKLKEEYKIPYWNINSLILFYCFSETENGNFYFTDALWGAVRKNYLFVNQLINKTNFNASITSLKTKNPNDIELKEVINSDAEEIASNKNFLARFGLFQNGTTLLPFDLLLNSPEGLTLFEHNASVLLQNELKPESEV